MINWFKTLSTPAKAGVGAFGYVITCGIVGAILGSGAAAILMIAGVVGAGAYAMASIP